MNKADELRYTMDTDGWHQVAGELRRRMDKHHKALLTCPLEEVPLHRGMIRELTAFAEALRESAEKQEEH